MLTRFLHLKKAEEPIVVREFGRTIWSNFVFANAEEPIVVREFGRVMFANFVFANAEGPISVILLGKEIEWRLLQELKQLSGIVIIFVDLIVTVSRVVHD